MIVFCDFCGIPVHQSCYGIEQVPEGEWFCMPCTALGKKRARNLKCALCPRFGGSMRPTNISARDEFFLGKSTTYMVESNPEPAPLPKQKNKKFSVLNKINDRKLFKSE